jgi:lipopolysaccharide transport system ATP-binding protein
VKEVAVSLKNVSKYYKLYKEPKDRMKEALHPFNKKYHKPFYALNDIDLEVLRGDVLGVVGRNGSGKSTLLKLITGVLQPNGGEIFVNGKITALLELGAGFNPEFTGLENIRFYSSVLGLADEEVENSLLSIIEFAELGEFIEQPVKTYSSGMKSRLGFAVAVHVEPEILILDEVLAVGDDAFKAKCYRKISEFLDAGKTVIIVSHNVHTINQLCTKAVLISGGRIEFVGAPKETTQKYHELLFGNNNESGEKGLPEIEKSSSENNGIESGRIAWDSSLKIQPITMLEETPVSTSGYRLVDGNGLEVNVLNVDESYRFSFTARISDQDICDLLFGVTIVNAKGIHVCGMEPTIRATENGTVQFFADFKCIFNEDVYTIIVASRLRSAEVVFYSRVENIGCYKVINSESRYRWGLVQL